jgi:hypothetical protein
MVRSLAEVGRDSDEIDTVLAGISDSAAETRFA